MNESAAQVHGIRGQKGWSLRNYMALFTGVLIAVAALAGLAVRSQSEMDARQSASADASFAAQRAAVQLESGFDTIRTISAPLAADPAIATVYEDPTKCGVSYAPIGAFDTGHIDIVRLDGSVVCSSIKTASTVTSPIYQGQSWLYASAPTAIGPTLDPVTRKQVVVMVYPVPGKGEIVWFLDLAPIGPKLQSEFGSGVHQLEFLITTSNGRAVVARSIAPAQWVGKNLSSSPFVTTANTSRPDLNGTQRIYGHTTIKGADWQLYVGADQAAALSAADTSSNRDLVIILAGVAIMLVVVFIVYQRISEPVRRLSNVMRGTTPGSAVKAVAGTGAFEVTALAEDFDKLMETVKRELADRLRTEQAAMVSERNYRMLFEGHPQPMWLYDVKTLAFLEVNDAAVDRYGYSRDEFLTMTIKDIRPAQDVPKFLELEALPMPAFDKSGPWRHLMKDGTVAEVLITSHTVAFAGHDARFVLAEDLSESQRLELELNQSRARAEASAELSRAKDEMVSMVSHELRTPLASIVGFGELLVTRDVTPAKRTEYLGILLQEGRRLSALINDFLDLRRIEGGHTKMTFAPADITALIRRAIDLMSAGGGIEIEARLPDMLPLVRVDADSIFRVVANLLSNARKYSPNGGSIVVSAAVVKGMVEVTVEDEGLGIPSDALNRVFDKFYRVDTDDRRGIKGTGLGLAISKNIVEGHGGKITASSRGVGKGSCFRFTVPLARDRAQTGDVLVVEDDSGFAHLLEAELAGRGLSTIWAPDAETAERLMTQTTVRAVVLDLLLPGLSGETLLEHLRAAHGSLIPVVIVTLKDLNAAQSLALQKLGVTAVLQKGPGIAETAANLIAKSLVAQLVAS
jgi:PAS domain S-box-containing protein